MAAEIKHAAMIPAPEHQDLRSAGDCPRRTDRHQIGFSAGIGEAHQLDRRETRADCRGKARLNCIVRAEIEALIERRLDRLADRRMRMTEDAGGELTEEIDIFVPVDVPQPRPFAARDRQRKRIDMDRRAGIAAGHRAAGFAMLRQALRVVRPVEFLCLGERRAEVDIGMHKHHPG